MECWGHSGSWDEEKRGGNYIKYLRMKFSKSIKYFNKKQGRMDPNH